MTTFPDMIVTMDKVVHDEEGAKFHWRLTGTNTGPGGTGKHVRSVASHFFSQLSTLNHELIPMFQPTRLTL